MPAALKMGVVVGVAAYILKWAELAGHISVTPDTVMSGYLYSGFQFTLAFMLVFRTSQSYLRFWNAATQLNSMRSQWYEAANWLVKFAAVSDASPERVLVLQHTLVRLFSMLGAAAMGALCDMKDDDYEVIDIKSFSHEDLDFLMDLQEENHRPSVVYQWIQTLMMKSVKDETLTVPAPMLTRVAQQLEVGMMNYEQVLLIMRTPFPFPYTQICFVLVLINMVATPFMMCRFTDSPLVASLFSMICIVCINTIHMIATEIEDPLGDDTNDLPCHEYHDAFNHHLALLLHPGTLKPPVLQQIATMNPDALLDPLRPKGLSLGQYLAERPPRKAGVVAEEKDDRVCTDVVLNVRTQQPSDAHGPSEEKLSGTTAVAISIPSVSTQVQSSMLPSTDALGVFLEDLSHKLLENQTGLNDMLIRQVSAVEKLVSTIPRSSEVRSGNDPPRIVDAQTPVIGLLSTPPGRTNLIAGRTPSYRVIEPYRLVEPSQTGLPPQQYPSPGYPADAQQRHNFGPAVRQLNGCGF